VKLFLLRPVTAELGCESGGVRQHGHLRPIRVRTDPYFCLSMCDPPVREQKKCFFLKEQR
jgi:hypothetical protein